MNVVVPPSNISSGLGAEERSFTWAIENFSVLRMHKLAIDSQTFSFTAGETTGHPSKWTVYLKEEKKDDKRWIGIYLKLVSPEARADAFNASYLQFRCTINNNQGRRLKAGDFGPVLISTKFFESPAWGFLEFIDPDDANLCTGEGWVIQITFKLYAPSPVKLTNSLEVITKKFQVPFLDQLRKDFDGLLEIPNACTDIKVISNDKKEFSMKRGILAARSEVFAAMLRSDMIEANSGVIKLSDISSAALEVFLNFLKTGALLPEWSKTGVIVELTNAAAEYQLKDLLQFLDEAMGKVCRLENVVPLATLARQLSLKVAEEELMLFARKEGFGSLDKLIQMCSTELPGNYTVPMPAAAVKKGKNRRKNQRW